MDFFKKMLMLLWQFMQIKQKKKNLTMCSNWFIVYVLFKCLYLHKDLLNLDKVLDCRTDLYQLLFPKWLDVKITDNSMSNKIINLFTGW